MKPRNRDCKSANANCRVAIADCRSANANCRAAIADCRSANANCRAAIAIAGQQTPIVKLQLQPLIDVRNPHVVRRHVAIVIAAHNHFPAHFDFIDRSKKSAEVRMSEVKLLIFQKELPLIFRNDPLQHERSCLVKMFDDAAHRFGIQVCALNLPWSPRGCLNVGGNSP